MKLYIARHGRTNYNDLDLCNADPTVDVHLTPLGVKQAQALAEKLKQAPLERIFVSQLRRTLQTAEIVNTFHGATIETSALLNDNRSGYEGKPAQLLREALDAADNKWTAHFNEGESIEDMKTRVAQFLNELKTKQYDTVLIITSGWIIKAIVAIIQDISNEEAWAFDAEQGSYIELNLSK